MQSVDEQRRAVRLLQFRAHALVDDVYAGLPERWAASVERHAVGGADGVARITPAGRRAILAECEAALVDLDASIAVLVATAVGTAYRLPRAAIANGETAP